MEEIDGEVGEEVEEIRYPMKKENGQESRMGYANENDSYHDEYF